MTLRPIMVCLMDAYGALAQLTVKPSDRITIGLTYINSYNQPLLTGSNAATSRP